MPSSEHVASFENTQGTTFDLLIRPHVSEDLRCNDLLIRLVEAVVVAFPQSTQQAIEDSIVAAIAEADGRFANINLVKISDDANNAAMLGSDNGLYVPDAPFQSGIAITSAGTTGGFTMPLTDFPGTNYQVSVEPAGDPGTAFRWWVTSKTATSVSVSFFTTNAVSLNIIAAG
jgi:hypothetical protein